MKTIKINSLLLSFIMVSASGIACGGDLDDGIKADELINDDLKSAVNIPFIMMKVKAAELRAKQGINSSRPVITQGENGQGNIVFGVGSKLAPGTLIINSSEIKNSNSISK